MSDVGVYLRDELFSSDIGIVNLHSTKGTPWVVYMNENYFDSYGCSPSNKLSNFNKKRKKHCVSSEYKVQGLKKYKKQLLCKLLFLYNLPEKKS